MVTYEQAIRCPRCGKNGSAVAGEEFDCDPIYRTVDGRVRQVTCECEDITCPFYQRHWYLLVNALNEVVYYTHTPYSQPAI